MNDVDLSKFIKALHLSARQHSTQRRKDAAASAYINHPIHLVKILWEVGQVEEIDVLIAALLHDTLEDTVRQGSKEDVTLQAEIQDAFGDKVLEIVLEVTDDKLLEKHERKQRAKDHAPHLSPCAKLVKLADKISNVSDIIVNPPVGWTIDRKLGYLNWAKAVVDGMRGACPALEKEFDTWYQSGIDHLKELEGLQARYEVIPGSGEPEDI